MQSEIKKCQNCKNDFTIEPEDFNFYSKMQVPPPTFCPECRFIRRFMWRNEGTLYKNSCKLCNKNLVTIFSEDNPSPIFCHDCWWGDNWDAMDYGMNYDFSNSFFTQFKKLLQSVPLLNLWSFANINSEYSNYTGYSKNSYLSNAVHCEDVYYSRSIESSRNCIDCYIVNGSELCYECLNCQRCFNSQYLTDSRECINSYFLFDCYNCQDCFMSSNLRNKRYYIRNKKYEKEEYKNEIEKLNLASSDLISKYKSEFHEMRTSTGIHRFAHIIKSINSDGDYINDSKDVHNCFLVEGENLKNCWRTFEGIKDCYDISGSIKNELIYEASVAADNSYMSRFYTHSKCLNNCHYLYLCSNSSNLFGCIGLKNKSYCILNKQYTKEEYEKLVPEIIKQMNNLPFSDNTGVIYRYGEFFPSNISPFSYNETINHEYFPLSKDLAIKNGYKWKEKENKKYDIDILCKDLPDIITNVKDDILGKVIECAHKSKCEEQCIGGFKLTSNELLFYKRLNIPIPKFCSNCRHSQRIKYRNPMKLWHRQCMCDKATHGHTGRCTNEFETSYAPPPAGGRPEIVYCEVCYNKEVY